ncbi:MAG: hypothetical protein ACRD3D_08800 [Terriglobia bacterium]
MTVASIPAVGAVDATATNAAAQNVQANAQQKVRQTVGAANTSQTAFGSAATQAPSALVSGESTETAGNAGAQPGAKVNTYA